MIRWGKDKLVSLRLRNGKYVLMQMLERKSQMIVFNIFAEGNHFEKTELKKEDILFITHINARSILNTGIYEACIVKNINPLNGITYPSTQIATANAGPARRIKLWEGTSIETEILFTGDGNNSLETRGEDGVYQYTPIQNEDYHLYMEYEINGLSIYPEFNERLYLCSELGFNIDPSKELAFNRELDPICKTYIDIIGGKVRLSELGY